jgi:dihydrofolate reductase
MSDHIAVFALGEAGEFGLRGGLPWGRIPEDMRVFREHTMGRTVLCGPKTFAAMGPLRGRDVLEVTRIERADGRLQLEKTGRMHLQPTARTHLGTAMVGGAIMLSVGILDRAFDELVISRIHGGPFEADVRMGWDFPGYECYSEEPVSERVTLTKWRKK